MYHVTKKQSGQSIIETIAAIFILVMAITSGLALMVYVFSNSSRSFNEIIGTNLAREGVNIVRNMRDTNWLESDAKGAAPWDLADCNLGSSVFKCYPRVWEGVPGNNFHSYSLADGIYRLTYTAPDIWALDEDPLNFNLYNQADGSYTQNGVGTPGFVRKIIISHNVNAPFASDSPSNLSELAVTAVVGWTGRGCTAMTGTPLDPGTTNCNVAVTERLTNWKDYK